MDAQVGRRFGRRVTPPERRLQRLQVHFTVFAAHFKLALERNKRALVRRGAHTPQTKFLHAEPGAYFTANLSYWPGGVGLTHRFPTNRGSVQLRQAPPFGYCCRATSNTQLSTVVASEAVEITLHFYKTCKTNSFTHGFVKATQSMVLRHAARERMNFLLNGDESRIPFIFIALPQNAGWSEHNLITSKYFCLNPP